MNYHNITTDDMLNGDGLRTVLWVAGCGHKCKGCHNPQTWDINGGIEFDFKALYELMNKCYPEHISGLTLSGGDPMHIMNRLEAFRILRAFKTEFPNKTAWVYTGYTWEKMIENRFTREQVLPLVDVMVCDTFVEELADINYKWAGSTNQRVINVHESLKTGSVVLYK